jgi:hypothetical protein
MKDSQKQTWLSRNEKGKQMSLFFKSVCVQGNAKSQFSCLVLGTSRRALFAVRLFLCEFT